MTLRCGEENGIITGIILRKFIDTAIIKTTRPTPTTGTRISMWFPTKWLRPTLLLGYLLLSAAANAADISERIVTRAQWPQYANGYSVSALPAVADALRRFEESGAITIVIRYPGGDSGQRWADELYGWLVSFGVPLRYLELEPGSGAADRLVVGVIDRG